ncbi:translocation protein TolB [Bacillus sp. FJAT-49705]|uniref:Translocation protein TolB n=1 Tax=Cytobacillus citreus TaxID=2833586 RepID=A0ABS5NXS3_9BACI|nr:translocation protein TolB [Cytobacillus citreus]MBS4192642.1 translocation protein TolB [Cytobacillus citreus]
MKRIIIVLAFIILSIQPLSFVSAESNIGLRAAFIRSNDLWIKIGLKEMKITNDVKAKFPKWSFDGNWIAYIRESKDYEGDLWLYHVKSNSHFKVYSNVRANFQWAPNQNTLGFQSDNVLKIIDDTSLNKPLKIASGIINFSWLPDGTGLLTSSKAGESVFSDIVLSKILISHNKKQYQSQHFYTIAVGKNEYFYGTSQFKWSNDRRWIAFQLVPTASLSADSNTLSVLSNDGQSFYKIDEMLDYDEWFQWAPSKNFLGYIQGFSRMAITNKKLKVANIDKSSFSDYTPKGYVYRDLTWQTNDSIFVSRSIDSEWVDVNQRPLPSLYKVDLNTKTAQKITSPSIKEGDFRPQSINNENKLIWIRTDREKAKVWIADSNGLNQKIWIKNMNPGTWYYEHWNWDEVFSLYQPI